VLSCYVILIFGFAMKLQAQGVCHFSGRGTGFYGPSSVTGLSPGESDRALRHIENLGNVGLCTE
jgi:hypothetical protein